jgi:CRP-like cAMP-binding protein
MKPQDLLVHPKLRKFVRKIPSGDYLFRQGDPGASMFFVIEGLIELIAERPGSTHTAGRCESGEFLGEKAFIRDEPHRRIYSARADGEATVLEISKRDIDFMLVAAPELMLTVLLSAFQVAVHRLENVNFLAAALRPEDRRQRLIGCLLYFCRAIGKPLPQGLQLRLTPASLSFHVQAPTAEIEHFLNELVTSGVIEKLTEDTYLVPDISRLEDLRREPARTAA